MQIHQREDISQWEQFCNAEFVYEKQRIVHMEQEAPQYKCLLIFESQFFFN